MKKDYKAFIAISYLLNLIGFGGMILLNLPFTEVFSSSTATILFIIGALGPGIIGIILSKDKLKEKTEKIRPIGYLLLIAFIFAHLGLYMFIGHLNKIENYPHLFFAIIICIILFGLQEIGWTELVFEHFRPEKGLIKSMAIVGLFKTIGFLPLFMLPGFIVSPESFAYFSVFSIGISALAILLKKISNTYINSILFVGIIYGIMYFMDLNQGITMVLIGFAEGIIVYGLQDLIKD